MDLNKPQIEERSVNACLSYELSCPKIFLLKNSLKNETKEISIAMIMKDRQKKKLRKNDSKKVFIKYVDTFKRSVHKLSRNLSMIIILFTFQNCVILKLFHV